MREVGAQLLRAACVLVHSGSVLVFFLPAVPVVFKLVAEEISILREALSTLDRPEWRTSSRRCFASLASLQASSAAVAAAGLHPQVPNFNREEVGARRRLWRTTTSSSITRSPRTSPSVDKDLVKDKVAAFCCCCCFVDQSEAIAFEQPAQRSCRL